MDNFWDVIDILGDYIFGLWLGFLAYFFLFLGSEGCQERVKDNFGENLGGDIVVLTMGGIFLLHAIFYVIYNVKNQPAPSLLASITCMGILMLLGI